MYIHSGGLDTGEWRVLIAQLEIWNTDLVLWTPNAELDFIPKVSEDIFQ